jgi:hypothetical protein
MKTVSTLALAGVALAASSAFADVIDTTAATGSELVLFVRDVNTPTRVYARGLTGITVDSVLTAAAAGGSYTGPVQSIGYSLPAPIGPDPLLTSFLSTSSNYVWTIQAGDTVGSGLGAQRYLTTTQIDIASDPSNLTPSNSTLRTGWGNLAGEIALVNAQLPDSGPTNSSLNGQWGQSGGTFANGGDWFGNAFNNENALGSSAKLFVLGLSSSSNTALARVFQAVDIQLDLDGTLHAVGSAAPVPLPPALWLLGSALVGLTGVARRRAENKVQSAVVPA